MFENLKAAITWLRLGYTKDEVRPFLADTHGTLTVEFIITLALGIIVLAALLPTAFQQFYAANTTTWSTAVQDMWALVPLMAILAVIVILVAVATKDLGK